MVVIGGSADNIRSLILNSYFLISVYSSSLEGVYNAFNIIILCSWHNSEGTSAL